MFSRTGSKRKVLRLFCDEVHRQMLKSGLSDAMYSMYSTYSMYSLYSMYSMYSMYSKYSMYSRGPIGVKRATKLNKKERKSFKK